ncbi:MAG: peptidoglycan editing factor PgeF, partial [Gammaproteobacteria bacterium]|nr:peptidoglycan editing factor PgeF [Gammaproteobacteria bacterium]
LPEAPRWLNQVHGTRIVEADKITGLVDADAVIAATPKTVCAILTADCLPLLFCDDQGRHVAAVHGGWRGLVGGIAEATVAEFARRGVDSSNLLVWLGPAISGRAYEVDEAVTRELEPADKVALTANAQGRWQLDLYGLARQRLSAVGVLSVTGGDRCTFSESEDFFSYRRDGRCGRQATLVWIDSGH